MREIDNENLGSRLAFLRAAYHLSRQQVCSLLDISPASVFRLEHHSKHRPHPFLEAKVRRLVKVLEAKTRMKAKGGASDER
jgi:transcriptional regulator with XRE-family HTH domain